MKASGMSASSSGEADATGEVEVDEDLETVITKAFVLWKAKPNVLRGPFSVTKELYRTRTAIIPKQLVIEGFYKTLLVTGSKQAARKHKQDHQRSTIIELARADGVAVEGGCGQTFFAMRLFGFLASKTNECLPFHSREKLCLDLGVRRRQLEYGIAKLEIAQVRTNVSGRWCRCWSLRVPTTVDELLRDYVMIPQAALLDKSLKPFDVWVLAYFSHKLEEALVKRIVRDLNNDGDGRRDGRQALRPRAGVLGFSWLDDIAGPDRERESLLRLKASGFLREQNNGYRLVPDPTRR